MGWPHTQTLGPRPSHSPYSPANTASLEWPCAGVCARGHALPTGARCSPSGPRRRRHRLAAATALACPMPPPDNHSTPDLPAHPNPALCVCSRPAGWRRGCRQPAPLPAPGGWVGHLWDVSARAGQLPPSSLPLAGRWADGWGKRGRGARGNMVAGCGHPVVCAPRVVLITHSQTPRRGRARETHMLHQHVASPLRGLSPRPYAYGAHALPAELRRPLSKPSS